jgi:hypothetical protein
MFEIFVYALPLTALPLAAVCVAKALAEKLNESVNIEQHYCNCMMLS